MYRLFIAIVNLVVVAGRHENEIIEIGYIGSSPEPRRTTKRNCVFFPIEQKFFVLSWKRILSFIQSIICPPTQND